MQHMPAARPVERRDAVSRRRHHDDDRQRLDRPEARRRGGRRAGACRKGPFGMLDAQGFTVMDKGAAIQFTGPAACHAERGVAMTALPRRRRCVASSCSMPAPCLALAGGASPRGAAASTCRMAGRSRSPPGRHRVAPERAGGDRPRRRQGGARTTSRDRRPADRHVPQEGRRRRRRRPAAPRPEPAPDRAAIRYRRQRDLPARGRGQRPHLHRRPTRRRATGRPMTSTRRCWC